VNAKEYDKLSAELATEADGIQLQKRPGYTGGNVDVLANFMNVADRIDTICPHCSQPHKLTAHNVWSVYFFKHIDAIISIMNRPDLPVSEAAIGRFSDARNYGALGYALQQERDNAHMVEKQRREEEKLRQFDAAIVDSIDRWRSRPATRPPTLKEATKAATTLLPVLSDGRQATPPQATLCDQAQIAALGEHMQRVRDSEEAAGRQATSPAPTEGCHPLKYGASATQVNGAPEASAGYSYPAWSTDLDTAVQLFELPQDNSPL
jgi:hypothetical protein